ncbi:MAG TPA: alkaline phosphatase PhoX, partial [Vicinamibacteria bacterium]|nr:alkaline phosphatase PhoX [Vicinamibacteria bacterium]
MKRRDLLRGLAVAGLLPGVESVLGPLARASAAPESPFARFDPIAPSDADDVVLPAGFRYDIVLKWGEPFTADGRPFGYNNDFIGVFPLQGPDDLLLTVNHEYISGMLPDSGEAPIYAQAFRKQHGRAPRVADYRRDLGVSVVRVRRDGASGQWRPLLQDRLNRRIDGFTP